MVAPDDTHGRRRRQFLKTGGGAVLAATGSGCLSTLPPLGQRVRYGRFDVPPAGDPDYRQWIPAASVFQQHVDRERTGFDSVIYTEPASIDSAPARAATGLGRGLILSRLDYFGLGYENYDRAFSTGGSVVVRADVDRSVVESTLAETSYEPAGGYRDYDCYRRTDARGTRQIAVGDGGVVFAARDDPGTAATFVERTIDARAGRIERRHETNERFAAISTGMGARPFVWINGGFEQGSFPPGRVHGGTSATFDSDAAYFLLQGLYPSGKTPEVDAIKRRLDDDDRAIDAEQVDVAVDGRLATIEIRRSRQRLAGEYDPSARIPQVTWHVERDGPTVRFRHEAGTTIDTDRLEFRPRLNDGGRDPFASVGETLEPGESISIAVDRIHDDYARLAYVTPDGQSTSVIAGYGKPD